MAKDIKQELQKRIDKKKGEKKAPDKKLQLEENEEIDLHELQIKLEKMKGYLARAEGRVRKHQLSLNKLRETQVEIESKRRDVALINRAKYDKKI